MEKDLYIAQKGQNLLCQGHHLSQRELEIIHLIEIGMSSKGNMGALAQDVAGLIAYTEVLVSGQGKASRPGKPLGNRFYLKKINRYVSLIIIYK